MEMEQTFPIPVPIEPFAGELTYRIAISLAVLLLLLTVL
jgi:hypothetical protein